MNKRFSAKEVDSVEEREVRGEEKKRKGLKERQESSRHFLEFVSWL
jgi:hypothetical protein